MWHKLIYLHLSMSHEKCGEIMLCTNRWTHRTRATYFPRNPERAPLPIPTRHDLKNIAELPDEESVIAYLTH